VQAAVDGEFNARNVGSVVAGEERHRRRDFLPLAEPLRGDLLKQGLGEFLGVGLAKIELAEKGGVSITPGLTTLTRIFPANTKPYAAAEAPRKPRSGEEGLSNMARSRWMCAFEGCMFSHCSIRQDALIFNPLPKNRTLSPMARLFGMR
jgi:hypothetical protein